MKSDCEQFEIRVRGVLKDIEDLLAAKNKRYGNSALEPIRIFSKGDSAEQLRTRIDDKLKRIQTMDASTDPEDTINDLIGYLVLLKIKKEEATDV